MIRRHVLSRMTLWIRVILATVIMVIIAFMSCIVDTAMQSSEDFCQVINCYLKKSCLRSKNKPHNMQSSHFMQKVSFIQKQSRVSPIKKIT